MKYLDNIPDKREDKNTTSLQFKTDLINFFENKKLNRCLEVGTNVGWTTRILSYLFEEVHTIEYSTQVLEQAKYHNLDRTNIVYHNIDATKDWNLPIDLFDVVFIDCIHSKEAVISDIIQSIRYTPSYLVFDDYGLPEELPAVKEAVLAFLAENQNLTPLYIGEPAGNEPRVGRRLVDWEGVVIPLIYS